jgi:pimeloyl-ACP methyl ester carboxylesterase
VLERAPLRSALTRIALERSDVTLIGTAVGTGPTALLLHAGGERRQVWDPIAQRLAGGGFRAVAYDLRGHGESGRANAGRLPAYADDVAAMIGREAGRLVLVGASLGGLAALLALRDPETRERVADLVLVDVVPDLPPARVRAYLNGLRDGLAKAPLVADIMSRRRTLRGVARELSEIPVVLVRGGRSHLTEADAQGLVDLAPTSRVETIARAGHLVAADAPVELARILLGVLGRRLSATAVAIEPRRTTTCRQSNGYSDRGDDHEPPEPRTRSLGSGVTLRIARATDAEALERLAQRDSAQPLAGPVLAAEIDGELHAAMALDTGRVVADPFHPTADLVELIHARAERLGARVGDRRRPHGPVWAGSRRDGTSW